MNLFSDVVHNCVPKPSSSPRANVRGLLRRPARARPDLRDSVLEVTNSI